MAGVDCGERDRPQRRAREPSRAAGQDRLQRPLVEGEASDRVHEAEPVRTGGFGGACAFGDVAHGRRQLRVERLAGHRARGRDGLLHALGNLVDVRAGEVQLDRRDVGLVQPLTHLRVLLDGEPADGRPNWTFERGEPRKVVCDEGVDPGIRKADRVQHSDVGLGDAHR